MGRTAVAYQNTDAKRGHLVVVLVDAVHPEVQDRSDAGQSEGRFRHVGGDDHLSTVNREDFSG